MGRHQLARVLRQAELLEPVRNVLVRFLREGSGELDEVQRVCPHALLALMTAQQLDDLFLRREFLVLMAIAALALATSLATSLGLSLASLCMLPTASSIGRRRRRRRWQLGKKMMLRDVCSCSPPLAPLLIHPELEVFCCCDRMACQALKEQFQVNMLPARHLIVGHLQAEDVAGLEL